MQSPIAGKTSQGWGVWRAHIARIAGLVPALLLVACDNHLYLPPARMLPLESAATLAPGEAGVQLEGGEHGAVLGASAASGTVRVRHGIAEDTDASAEVSLLHIGGNSVAGTFPNAFAARAGVKRRLLRWLSVLGGVGGGASAAGGFVAPDAGLVAAYENGIFVPFFSLRAGVSLPFDVHPVDTGQANVDPLGEYVYTAPTTWMMGGVLGFRIPFGPGPLADDIAWPSPGRASHDWRGSLLAGVGITDLQADGGPSAVVASWSLGGEVVF